MNVAQPTEQSLLLNTSQSNLSESRCQHCVICIDWIKSTLWKDPYRKLIYSALWWLLTGYLTGLTNAIADNRALSTYPCNVYLRDLGFDLVSMFINTDQTYIDPHACDICLYITLLSMILYVLFTKTKKKMAVIATRYIIMFNVLFTLRVINICLTVFPTPAREKLPYSCKRWPNVWIAPVQIAFGNRMSCSDFFFSGHTTNAVIAALIVTKYINEDYKKSLIDNQNSKKMLWIRLLFLSYIWFTVFLVIFFLLVLEFHYSIDISTAIMLTVLIWVIAEFQLELQRGFFNWWHVSCDDEYVAE
eukprot:488711_1